MTKRKVKRVAIRICCPYCGYYSTMTPFIDISEVLEKIFRGFNPSEERMKSMEQEMAHDKLKIGRAKENECGQAMADNGMLQCYWHPPRAKYAGAPNTGQDIFGVFDFIGVGGLGEICGVQVCRKRPGEISLRRSKIEHFCARYKPMLRPFLAVYDKTGFIIEEYLVNDVWRYAAALPFPTASAFEP